MAPTPRRRWLVALVATATVWLQVGLSVSAGGPSLFRGRVLAADGATPRPGVTIALLHETDGRVFRSAPTDDRGVFRVDSASPGTYRVVAETAEGAFVAPGSVHLDEGANPPVALALQPTEQDQDAPAKDEKDEKDPAAGDQDDPAAPGDTSEEAPSSLPPPQAKKEGLSPLVKGIVIGVVGLVAIGVVLEITDEEDTGSPF